jgi:hypothetical protein
LEVLLPVTPCYTAPRARHYRGRSTEYDAPDLDPRHLGFRAETDQRGLSLTRAYHILLMSPQIPVASQRGEQTHRDEAMTRNDARHLARSLQDLDWHASCYVRAARG